MAAMCVYRYLYMRLFLLSVPGILKPSFYFYLSDDIYSPTRLIVFTSWIIKDKSYFSSHLQVTKA